MRTGGRELLIMRHAKSDWEAGAADDFHRPLARRGKRDAPRMGRWLREQGLVPELLVSSPAVRARKTTLRLCEAMGCGRDMVRWDERVYEASVGELLAVLSDCPPQARRVLLVGHNPGLEGLVLHLAGGDLGPFEAVKLMPTAAVARIRLPGSWEGLDQGQGELVSITRPRDLDGESQGAA